MRNGIYKFKKEKQTMQDRFKFRAVVKGYYEINLPDEYEEVEPLIILDNIDILKNGGIGLMEDDLETAIREQHSNLNSAEISHILEFFNNNSNGIDDYVTITPEVICQCTGLKDKNGNLIYEGDIVKDLIIPEIFYVVKWFNGGFHLKSTISSSFLKFNDTQQEVIGNIYENQELLKEVK